MQQRLLFASNQLLGRTLAARADLLAAAGRHGEAAQAARGAADIVAAAFGERAVQTALARRAAWPCRESANKFACLRGPRASCLLKACSACVGRIWGCTRSRACPWPCFYGHAKAPVITRALNAAADCPSQPLSML